MKMITVRFLSGEIWEITQEEDKIQHYLAERLGTPAHRIHLIEEEKRSFHALVRPPPMIQLTDEHLALIDWQNVTHPDLLDLLLHYLARQPPHLVLSNRRWNKVWANPHPPLVRTLIGLLEQEDTWAVSFQNKRSMNRNPNDEMIDRILHTSFWLPETMCMNTNVRAVRACLSYLEKRTCDPIDCVYKRMIGYTTDREVFDVAFLHLQDVHQANMIHHISYVSHHAHLIPRIGDLLLKSFEDVVATTDLRVCTDSRVVQRLIDGGWVDVNDLGTNPSDAAVDWLLSFPFEASHVAIARNPHPRVVAYVMDHLERIEAFGDLDFWEKWVSHPAEDAIRTSIEWIVKQPSTRVKWFLDLYRCMRPPNTRLLIELYERLPDSFPCDLVSVLMGNPILDSIGRNDIRFERKVS